MILAKRSWRRIHIQVSVPSTSKSNHCENSQVKTYLNKKGTDHFTNSEQSYDFEDSGILNRVKYNTSENKIAEVCDQCHTNIAKNLKNIIKNKIS